MLTLEETAETSATPTYFSEACLDFNMLLCIESVETRTSYIDDIWNIAT